MEHKLMVAASLREGIAKIKAVHQQMLAQNPLWQQWAHLGLQEMGIEWRPHTKIVEDHFAWKSHQMLKKLKSRVREAI